MSARPELVPTPQHEPDSLPTNILAERSLLGGLISDHSRASSLVRASVSFGLTADDFAQSAHRKIFETLVRMANENKPIDLVLIADKLDVTSIGGHAYLCDLTSGAVPVESHVLAKARIIKRDAQLRRIISFAEQLELAARKRRANPEEIVTDAVRKLTEAIH